MARNRIAALAALALISTPSAAFDLNQPSEGVKFYYSIPLDARTPKEQAPAFGLQFQGRRPYETVMLDSRMLNFTGTGIEAKWIIAGVVAAGATAAVAAKSKSTSSGYQASKTQQAQQQQQQQQQPPQEPCPVTPTCP
jgi:hypothetical protein